jgi:hypothetical protein
MFDDDTIDEQDGMFEDEDAVIEDVFLGDAAQDAWEWANDDDDLY